MPVEARAYFSPAQLEKAESFRNGQLWLFGASLLIEAGVLVLVWRQAPRRLRGPGQRHPVLTAAAATAGISVALGVATLPVSLIARERAKDVGLVTQSLAGYAGDFAKSQAIGALLWGAGGALLMVGLRKLGRRWWIAGSGVVVAFGIGITYAGPIVLDPLFNKFTPLEQGQLRSEVLSLAKRAGVSVGQVYEVDASRRTTASNAYVNGIGHTKRVVLYDNLLKDFSPAEVRFVVAHELGHVRHRDVPRGLLYLAIVAPFALFAVARLGERLAGDEDPRSPAALPALLLAIALLTPVITVISNQLSRSVERSADAFALRLDDEPKAQIDFQRRIAIKNVSDPDPPAWVSFLLGTHPTTLQRIGQAEAAARASSRDG